MPGKAASPSTTPSRRQLQRAASVSRIVTAAAELFSEADRFSDTSVEQVISRARVSRSTFYSYFDDMGHLLRVVAEDVVGDVISAARRWMSLDSGPDRAGLLDIFDNLVSTYRRRAKLLAALAEASIYDPGVRENFHQLLGTGHTELAKHIRRAQADGTARADLDPDSTAAWLVWMIERGLYQQVRTATRPAARRHTEALTSIVWHALYEPQPGKKASAEKR